MTWAPNKWTINKGEAEKLLVHALDEDGDPISLSGVSSVEVQFKNADLTTLSKPVETGFTWGILPPISVYGISLTAAETALFAVGVQTVQLSLIFSGGLRQIIDYRKALIVLDPFIT